VKNLIALAGTGVALICGNAEAAVIDFSKLSGNNGDFFRTYSDGLTVNATTGLPRVGQAFGNPAPSIFFNGGVHSITVIGGIFRLDSYDLTAASGTTLFNVTGSLNGSNVYNASFGLNQFATFSTILTGSTALMDKVVFSFDVRGTSANIDNITFSGFVPEPGSWLLMIAGFGMVAGAMRYKRRRSVVAFA